VVFGLIAIYASLILLFSLPLVQKQMASGIAGVLSKQLQSQVEIGSVNLGFLTRIIINDLTLNDRQGVRMLKVARLSASINYVELAQGNIVVPTAQLFSPRVVLYRDSIGAKPNYQFLIDTFQADTTKEKKPLNLRINSFILRHADISYDVKDQPHTDSIGTDSRGHTLYSFDVSHLHLKEAGMNVSLKALTGDSLSLSVKRLSARELNTGLSISELDMALDANRQQACLSDFRLKSSHSSISIDTLLIHYPEYEADGTFSLDTATLAATLTPADFQSLLPALRAAYTPLHLTATLSGNSRQLTLSRLSLQDAEAGIRLNAHANATLDNGKLTEAQAYVSDLHVTADGLHRLFGDLMLDEASLKPLLALGDIDYTGTLHHRPGGTTSEGRLLTQAGQLDYQAELDPQGRITGHLLGRELNLAALSGNPGYGVANIDLDGQGTLHELTSATGQLDVQSEALDVQSELEYHKAQGRHQLNLILDVANINPHALGLSKDHEGEQYQFYLKTLLTGSSIDDVTGHARLYDVRMMSDSITLDLNAVDIDIKQTSEDEKRYTIDSDFLTADIQGQLTPSRLPATLVSMLHPHLPTLIRQPAALQLPPRGCSFTYSARLTDNPFLQHFLGHALHFDRPVSISGYMDAPQQQLSLRMEGRQLEYGGNKYHNMVLTCTGSPDELTAQLSAITIREESAAKIDAFATAADNNIESNINLQIRGNTKIDVGLNSTLAFADSLGAIKTSIDIGQSSLSINDTLWQVSPASLSFWNQEIVCNDLHFSSNDSYLNINGVSSPHPGDSIVAELRNVQIEYILDAVNFTSVDFGGWASGTIVVDEAMSDTPMLAARLHVRGLSFEGGHMGNTDIAASWDNGRKAIMLDAECDSSPIPEWDDQTRRHSSPIGGSREGAGFTLHGYVSPANDDIQLDIAARQTPADFLNGFLDGVFSPITGTITGQISVVGPLSDINIVGEADATLSLSLLATDVPYSVSNQHVSLKRDTMQFSHVTIADRFGNQGRIDGLVTHRSLTNFRYNFDVSFSHLLAYEERTFNADKFYATVFADGNLNLHGRDGHPMYLTANLTPTRGSTFAYDAASPDAIVSNSFIEFHDVTPLDTLPTIPTDYLKFNYFGEQDSPFGPFLIDHPLGRKNEKAQDEIYHGDLYMDFNINLNEDCEIRLRMDNTDDGYITVRGGGALTAKYHNKGTLELFGTYNITQGSYRLYLQNLIYRDLAMQPGSSVEFNGPPFEAGIHLICHHLVSSVPLVDLTATNTIAQNNKVRVNCILDITGNLGNMAFKFDFDILNTNDEVRQLVRSMINSEEEMNTQMIYLLALGRFYPTNMARANSDDASTSAVNSLVSSTISGQINNIISNLMGRNSNWNFGTGISTGERGWDDLDVEGTLSGRLFDDRLLINGNFGYRDNALTNQGSFIGDVEVKWRLKQEGGNMYLKAYNQTNDRYFTKATLNTQGIGLSYLHEFETWRNIFKKSPSAAQSTLRTPAGPAEILVDSVH